MRSDTIAAITGITYRRLDYLTRTLPQLHHHHNGSGYRRTWTPTEAARLTIAHHLTQATTPTLLPTIANACLTTPHQPPLDGWATWTAHTNQATWDDHPPNLHTDNPGLVLAHFDLVTAFGNHAPLLTEVVADRMFNTPQHAHA